MIFCLFFTKIAAVQLAIETFNVSLDDPAESRWNEVLLDQKQEIIHRISSLESVVSYFDRLALAQTLLRSKLFPSEILQEMKSASLLLGVDLDSILLLNLMNEFYSDGAAFLIITENFQAILAKNFERSGCLLYESLIEVGSFSPVISTKPLKFAVTVNKKNKFKQIFSIWETFQILSGGRSASVSVRWAMENLESFEDFLSYLNSIPLISSSYFSIAGVDRAAVVSRDPKFVADVRQTDEEKWLLVQRDLDHWLPNQESNEKDSSAVSRIAAIGREYLNEEVVFELLNLSPTLSSQTTATVIINPANEYWFAVART